MNCLVKRANINKDKLNISSNEITFTTYNELSSLKLVEFLTQKSFLITDGVSFFPLPYISKNTPIVHFGISYSGKFKRIVSPCRFKQFFNYRGLMMREKSQRIFISLIFILLAYEWTISGLNKILSGHFISDLHKEYLLAIPDMKYTFYADFLKAFCLPHCTIIGYMVESGEILLGIAFIILAFNFFKGHSNTFIMILGVAVGLVSAFMTLNFFFYQGGSIFLNPSDPFDEGISVDLILFILQLGISLFYYLMLTSVRKDNLQPQS